MKDLKFTRCPKCSIGFMTAQGERTGGFSGGKALLGAALIGPVGLVAGALGKKKTLYVCNRCNYTIEN